MGWEDIDLLKIDIEGAEKEVWGSPVPGHEGGAGIIGEGHVGVGYTIEACRADLEPWGFEWSNLKAATGPSFFLLAVRIDQANTARCAWRPG